MLATLGFDSVDELVRTAVPEGIQLPADVELPGRTLPLQGVSEREALRELRQLASRNSVGTSFIGQGYYGTLTPAVIQRNVLENPSWYTAYTPYQPEISQGRLEALINFQQMVCDLTGLDIANASMLDEGTAVAEGMLLARRASRAKSNAFLVDTDTFPQTLAILRGRAAAVGIELIELDLASLSAPSSLSERSESKGAPLDLPDVFGAFIQYPSASGRVWDPSEVIAAVHAKGGLAVAAADLLSLALLKEPGALGADIAVGTTQRFGVPMGFGGPHAGYMAVRSGLERQLPGRLVGVSQDAAGKPAYRLTLQTREQHIRREKATSNICTAQVLLAVMASMYAVYHGPRGIRAIAQSVHAAAAAAGHRLQQAGIELVNRTYFDTLAVRVPGRADEFVAAAHGAGLLITALDADTVCIAFDELTASDGVDIERLLVDVFGVETGYVTFPEGSPVIPEQLARASDYLTHPVFSSYHSETAMMRYLKQLADRDYALDRGMIPLGSCTMKLNAATEMAAVTWPEFASLHPFAPAEDVAGYLDLIAQLETWLAELTGYDTVSLQPNAGSQGELAGLLAIRGYHDFNGDTHRTVCLIPQSAHGTNAASAVLAGMRVVVVATDDSGNVDLDDLRAKVAEHASELAALMITYPSTHGVYEHEVVAVIDAVHEAGGQVYIDGANLNALLGFARFGDFGGDVSHLNLHKTFCVPHGGGGPGVGPVGAKAHLAPYLPGHPLMQSNDHVGYAHEGAPVSAAPYGSPSILPISWAYVRMMGADGLARATGVAVVSANYVAARLRDHYPVLYAGERGLVAHECILDIRPLTDATGVTVDDVAKRLIDYGFHAPTMSFPVAGTLMVEPTESEDLAELDR
ncbi:MAG TPA: aminomethyl-transferring glycine dehydrogenase, partial [Humibacter sp.]|nr:aminomethyl-transferring glycine dehydrogenase [Humibacter sp.]